MVQFLLNKGEDPHVTQAKLSIYTKHRVHSYVDMEILNGLAVAGG